MPNCAHIAKPARSLNRAIAILAIYRQFRRSKLGRGGLINIFVDN
ncbi:hypothetical protein QUB05_31995 [Microcoleus sp. F10-C6]